MNKSISFLILFTFHILNYQRFSYRKQVKFNYSFSINSLETDYFQEKKCNLVLIKLKTSLPNIIQTRKKIRKFLFSLSFFYSLIKAKTNKSNLDKNSI